LNQTIKKVVIKDAGSLFLGKNQVLGIEGVSVTAKLQNQTEEQSDMERGLT
jgi:hypothetical protein